MDALYVVIGFGIMALLALMYLELKRFVDYITAPQPQMMMAPPMQGYPAPRRRGGKRKKDEEPIGFKLPEKEEENEIQEIG